MINKISLKNLRVTLIILVFSVLSIFSQEGKPSVQTAAYIDLNKATADHKVYVEVQSPTISDETIEYHFPKMVPGTYAIYNFGRFITGFKAFDTDNNELKSEQLDTNIWKIYGAQKLSKVGYYVEDTYHSDSKPTVFEPVGSCIEPGKVFVLNNFCFVGFFNGFKDTPFILTVDKPAGFYGSTSLPLASTTDRTDIYNAKNYFELHDNPILYSIPDTASVMVNNTHVLLSIYSPASKVSASYMIDQTRQLFEAQGKYLGGTLPTDRYTILVYLFQGASKSGSAGALEHFKSTSMVYPETEQEDFVEPFKDVISHEFFHIITPLSIHSYEIHDFDFDNPKMSKHLWLYEGSTEYYAHNAQVKFGVMTPDKYFEKLHQKMLISSLYFNDTLPFTELSKGALDVYKQQYINVYLKGALISMCLDLYLLHLSDGKYGLVNLKHDLMERFGPDKPFNDNELFDIITEITYAEVRDFFKKYVEGPEKLPYKQMLAYAGYDFYDKLETEKPAMLGASMENQSDGSFKILEVLDFGKKLKLKEGDIVVSINGMEIHAHNYYRVAGEFERTTKTGDEVTVVIMRKDKSGEMKKKTLKAETYLVKKQEYYYIKPMENPTAEQLAVRKAWINQ